MTHISWTDESWNPVTGCTPVSEGCAHCYAKRMTERFGGDFSKVRCHPVRLNSENSPLHWRKPRMVFVSSMGDLFHEDVPYSILDRVFGTIADTPRHTYQILTKRPERMRHYMETFGRLYHPFPNVWLGVSVENQARADERIPILLETPAAVRFVSCEPLLGPLDLGPWLMPHATVSGDTEMSVETTAALTDVVRAAGHRLGWQGLDWVIVGGESGPGARLLVEKVWHETATNGHWEWKPKPEALRWVRKIRDDCQAAGVPFFFKQWGPRAGQGTLLDGREHKEMPEVRA